MPELPEVETVRRGLAARLTGARFTRVDQNRPNLRYPFPERFPERLTGRRIGAIDRRAKYLLFALDDGTTLVVHLGMSGRMLLRPGRGYNATPHDHVVFAFDGAGGEIEVIYNDVRRFGLMDLIPPGGLPDYPAFAKLGPEPLSDAFDGPFLHAALQGKATPIKAALLDQHLVAGLGNIYVCEALFGAGISPKRLSSRISAPRAGRLAAEVKSVLERAIAAGGSSLRDYVQADGELGYFQHSWAVYGREDEPCRRNGCGGTVQRLTQSGRSTFYCARCQR